MLKYLFFLLCLHGSFCLISCNANKAAPIKEFEGIITYKTAYSSWNNTNRNHYSDTVKIFYSHGNLVKLHSGNSLTSVKKEIFLHQNHQYYFTRFNVDTLFTFDITTSPGMDLADMKVLEDKNILGHSCQTVALSIKNKDKELTFYTDAQYTFSKGYLPVDKANFANYKFAYFNKFIDESGCFYLRYKYAVYSSTGHKQIVGTDYEAISVSEQKLDPHIFDPDKFPIKEFELK